MNLTPPVLGLIIARFRDPHMPKINQAQMAEHMGYGRSWATKLMKGKIKSIDDEDAVKLEKFLGIRLLPYIVETGDQVPTLAIELGQKMKDSEPLTKVVSALLEIATPPPVVYGTKWIDTKDMTKFGQEAIRICFANEDKPGKAMRLILEMLK